MGINLGNMNSTNIHAEIIAPLCGAFHGDFRFAFHFIRIHLEFSILVDDDHGFVFLGFSPYNSIFKDLF